MEVSVPQGLLGLREELVRLEARKLHNLVLREELQHGRSQGPVRGSTLRCGN